MEKSLPYTDLLKQPGFKLKPGSVVIFIVAATAAWLINIFAQVTFPSRNLIPYVARTTITLFALMALIIVTIRLLKQNQITTDILRLKLSGRSFMNLLSGMLIGILTIALLMAVLYAFIPFHFITGPFSIADVLKEGYSWFLSNSLEELMFRGFLLLVLCQFIGWQKAVWVMALPFGLFHLPGLGLSMAGLKMVMTTAAFSFIFSYAFILTGSVWGAIGAHVMSNILLHAVVGLDGANNSMFVPVFETQWPVNYDPGFITSLIVTVIVAGFLFLAIKYRNRLSG